MTPVWITVAVIAGVLLLMFIVVYNGLIASKNQVDNAWRQIDVQLKRRYDLIPNLVETAKAYLKHERETLEAVVKARQQAIDASSVTDQAKAENFLTSTLRSLFAVSEAYPDLKANQNMMQIQEELTSTENRIGFSRQHYNDSVMTYNNKLQQFPGNVVKGFGTFPHKDYFELEDAEQREPVKVQF